MVLGPLCVRAGFVARSKPLFLILMTTPVRSLVFAVLGCAGAFSAVGAELPRIEVSANHRHFVTENGDPFFYLADTGWGLFRLNREDATHYLEDRASKNFTVIQAIIGFWGSLDRINPDGHPMFADGDPTKPNEAFFAHVDWIINQAESLGLRIAIVPIWSRSYVNQNRSIFDEATARDFGRFLGARYRNRSVFWILGGDWTPPASMHALWRSMAAGIEEGEGTGHHHLKTYHPRSPESSSFWYHNEHWLDFNLEQTTHSEAMNRNYELIDDDYHRMPVKPVLDGEPAYENIDDRYAPTRVQASTIRRQAYCAVFAGAAGHTYGADSVYGFRSDPINADVSGGLGWRDALQLPGASQVQFVRALLESRPMLNRIPDQWLIVNDPGSMSNRIQACRADDGSYAFVYSAAGRPFTLKLRLHGYDKIVGEYIRCWWYDPRTGEATLIDERPRTATNDRDRGRDDIAMEFTPPSSGPGNDWVLVIDDASRGYPAPGKKE